MSARLESLNIGAVREIEHNGRIVTSGIFKHPTTETQRVAGVNVGADQQADPNAHGGPEKAVYAYAAEDYQWWEAELGQALEVGIFGENFTTSGIDLSAAQVGDRWVIGSAQLEVSEPRLPCFKLGIRTGIARMVQQFVAAGRPGAYLRILSEGDVTVGDDIQVISSPDETPTMQRIAQIYHKDRTSASELLGVPGLSAPWSAWAEKTAHPDAET